MKVSTVVYTLPTIDGDTISFNEDDIKDVEWYIKERRGVVTLNNDESYNLADDTVRGIFSTIFNQRQTVKDVHFKTSGVGFPVNTSLSRYWGLDFNQISSLCYRKKPWSVCMGISNGPPYSLRVRDDVLESLFVKLDDSLRIAEALRGEEECCTS